MALLDSQQIVEILPHRFPFLLVDRILECDDRERIVGIKNVTRNEHFFQGHFPERPVMPGVLQLEAMAQTGAVLLNRAAGAGKIAYLLSIEKAKFRRAVTPGDQLRIEVTVLRHKLKTTRFRAVASVDGEVASEAEMMCYLTGEEQE